MRKNITATHERVDDIPTIIAHLKKRRVAECLDHHFSTNGHGQGWPLGWTTVVWVPVLLSEGAHRRSRVEPWVKAHPCTLSRCPGRQVTPRALTDARLATTLDDLCGAARWVACERARNQSVRRVYDMPARAVHVDTTPAAASVTPAGLCQLGPSKAHRPDRPQGTVALSVLDPLGVPLTRTVVAGQTADEPLSLPEIATVRQSAQITGLPDVGDGTMAAISTRAAIVAHQDDSLGPLAATQRPEAPLDRVRAPGLRGGLEPSASRLPNAAGALDEPADSVASGLAYTVERSAPDQARPPRTWQERQLVVRSLAWAARQAKSVRQRVARAVTEINALDARPPGQPRGRDEVAAHHAAAAIMATYRVEGLGTVTVRTAVHEHVKRRYGTRPATTGRSARGRVRATSDEATRAQAAQRVGWRVYATQPPTAALTLAQGVAASRSAYLIAQGFGRFKGRAWSLTPRLLQYAHRVVGLLDLLSLARRVLVLMQCVVRRTLQQAGTTRTGISPSQPGRQPAQPTTEMRLQALRGVTRSRITIDGTFHNHLTPLHAVQKRILALLEVPLEISDRLVT